MTGALLTLMEMYKQCQENKSELFRCRLIDNDYFRWRFIMIGPKNTIYYGGFFPVDLEFDEKFPNSPPKMYFKCPMWHPNISQDPTNYGNVCINVLHDPDDERYSQFESKKERWNPNITIELIFSAVNTLLQEPGIVGPYNVSANSDFLNDRSTYYEKVKECVKNSINYI